MSHQAPSITEWGSTSDGSMKVAWEVDSFFPDSEAPDDVLVDLDGIEYRDLGSAAREIEIPPKDLKPFEGHVLIVGVTFKWSGSPADTKVSSVSILVGGSVAPSGTGPSKPAVTIKSATAQTLKHPNQIILGWSSYSYNDGNILWGPISNPRMWSHSIKPKTDTYSGEWTTDRPLASRAIYSFTVQVKNSLTTNVWVETTVAAKSAVNFHSVRQFLNASGVQGPSLRKAIGHGGSLRQTMGI
jgi:hypothetical protein